MVQLYRLNVGDRKKNQTRSPTRHSQAVFSPRLFTLYLDETPRQFDSHGIIREPRHFSLHGHVYAVNDPLNLNLYLVSLDELDFRCRRIENPGTIVKKLKNEHPNLI